jgi:ribosomal protein S18 acetylase RimI-like enzyme
MEHWAGARTDGAALLLADAGYEHARTMWRMRRELVGDLPAPVWPAGVEARTADYDREAREVFELVMRGFAGTFGSHQRPYEEWAGMALAEGRSAIVAVEGHSLIGVATVGPRNGEGHVNQLTVDPAHRGRGLALALLHEAFRRDAAAGYPATALTVDGENDNARRLYEKAGMTVVSEFRRWERDV